MAIPFSRGSSQPGSQPPSPILQADSLPSEPPGNPQRVLGLWSSGFLAYWNSLISPEWTTLDFMIQNNERSVKWGTWHMASSLSSSELCKVLFWTLGKRLNSGAGSLLPSALLQAWCVPLAPDHPSHGLASPPWHISHTVSLASPDPHDPRCGLVPKSCPTVTTGTVAHQAPLSMGFLRQEYWGGLPRPPPGHLPDPGIKPSPPALAGGFFSAEPQGSPRILTAGCYTPPLCDGTSFPQKHIFLGGTVGRAMRIQ